MAGVALGTYDRAPFEKLYARWVVEVLGPGNFHHLARRSGLSRSTVSGVLQGKRGASLDTLRRLSEASGVELGRLTEYVDVQRKGRSK